MYQCSVLPTPQHPLTPRVWSPGWAAVRDAKSFKLLMIFSNLVSSASLGSCGQPRLATEAVLSHCESLWAASSVHALNLASGCSGKPNHHDGDKRHRGGVGALVAYDMLSTTTKSLSA